jgi:P27 family predicted phage terminase small subunit
MGRPAKSISTASGARTAKEIQIRKETEKRTRGKTDKLVPPSYLTKEQKDIYKYIVQNLKDAEILGNLDHYILSFTAVTIDKIIQIDRRINSTDDVAVESKLISARSTLAKDFFRCCNELTLSPQARAKISIANVKAATEEKNPLLEALDL